MGNYYNMILAHEGKITQKITRWEKPEDMREGKK